MDKGSFIINTKTEDFYEDISNDVKKRFEVNTSNYIDTSIHQIMKSIDLLERIKKW